MTLSHRLGFINHVSLLKRKACRVGITSLRLGMGLAVERGCKHYEMGFSVPRVCREDFTDEELVIFLLLGCHEHEPLAIRIAAQLLGGAQVDMDRVLELARKERVTSVLSYILNCAREHDEERDWAFHLEKPPLKLEVLPHWSRFMSIPGVERGGKCFPENGLLL